jgi:type IV fimbrial biogenesis protein FimT
MKHSQLRAFSLIETLVALTVLSSLISIAIPSLSSIIQSSRQTTQTNQLIGALNYARSAAIANREMVSLCAGNTNCSHSTRWREKILIFRDLNRDGQLNQGDTLLVVASLAENYSWNWSNFRNQNHMSYKPDGTTHSLNGTFTLCLQDHPTRAVVINAAGRARLSSPKKASTCAN